MRTRWLAAVLIAIAPVIAWRTCAGGGPRQRERPDGAPRVASVAAPAPGATTGGHIDARRFTRRSAADRSVTDSATRPPFRTATSIVGHNCDLELDPVARCAAAAPLATSCDDGDAEACVRLYELMMTPPSSPDLSMVYLRLACDLDHERACERAE